jgi:hypothetical protein
MQGNEPCKFTITKIIYPKEELLRLIFKLL